MNAVPSTLRTRLTALRKDPRLAALTLLGPGGQALELVDLVVAQLDSQAARLAELEAKAAHLARELEALQLPRHGLPAQHPLPQSARAPHIHEPTEAS
jgi:hypothetical protein